MGEPEIQYDQASGAVVVTHQKDKASPLTVVKQEDIKGEPDPKSDTGFRIAFSLTRTVNLGGFESASVFVSLTAPTNEDDLQGDFEEVSAWVKQRIGEEVSEISKYKKSEAK